VAVVSGAAGYALNRAVTGSSPARTTATATGPATDPTRAAGLAGLTAEQVALRLAAAGLPLRTTIVYNQANDPDNILGRPGSYTSKIAFGDPRIGGTTVARARADAIERGGSIEVYPDAFGAQARAEYLRAVSSTGSVFAAGTRPRGGIVLRVSRYLPPEAVRSYETTLRSLAGADPGPGRPNRGGILRGTSGTS
jgi:hypothetical protein